MGAQQGVHHRAQGTSTVMRSIINHMAFSTADTKSRHFILENSSYIHLPATSSTFLLQPRMTQSPTTRLASATSRRDSEHCEMPTRPAVGFFITVSIARFSSDLRFYFHAQPTCPVPGILSLAHPPDRLGRGSPDCSHLGLQDEASATDSDEFAAAGAFDAVSLKSRD